MGPFRGGSNEDFVYAAISLARKYDISENVNTVISLSIQVHFIEFIHQHLCLRQ